MLKKFLARFSTTPEDRKKMVEGMDNMVLKKTLLGTPDLALRIGALEELIRRFENRTTETTHHGHERSQ